MRLPLAAGTVVTHSFLGHARVVAESFHAFHPAIPFFVVVTDDDGTADGGDGLEVIPGRALGAPDYRRLAFAHGGQPLCVALKPRLLEYLLDRASSAVFLDADVLVTAPLDAALAAVRAHALALTPHLIRPSIGAPGRSRDLTMLLAGAFNGGFVGVSDGADTRAFLAWWADRLATHGRMAPAKGMHGDQRWLDMAPGLLDRVAVLRDPALNVAYWNLHERQVDVGGDGILVDGRPLAFFHFSGFEPRDPACVSVHARDMTRAGVGPLASLFDDYAARLTRAGLQDPGRQPDGLDRFDNGIRIPAAARRLYLDMGEEAVRFGDPFTAAGPQSFFTWLTAAEEPSAPGISRLWAAIYRSRPDLREHFADPLRTPADGEGFVYWARGSGSREHDVDERLGPGWIE